MGKMTDLYEKVAKDSALQEKFNAIISDAQKAGKDETEKKLVAFAKTEGYEVTVEEIRDFFSTRESKREGALSEDELDVVAGGKNSSGDNPPIQGLP